MKRIIRATDDDARDLELGAALRGAAGIAGSTPPAPAVRSRAKVPRYLVAPGLAAGVLILAGVSASIALLAERRSGREEALEFARFVLPEASAWVGEAIAYGGEPADL